MAIAPDGPPISVVIPTYRGERVLPECLRALRRQTLGGCEVIVVANGASTELLEMVRGGSAGGVFGGDVMGDA